MGLGICRAYVERVDGVFVQAVPLGAGQKVDHREDDEQHRHAAPQALQEYVSNASAQWRTSKIHICQKW